MSSQSRRGRSRPIGTRTNKGVDEYAAQHPSDLIVCPISCDGQVVRTLVCKFCWKVVGARSDRIKEHIASKRHHQRKLENPEGNYEAKLQEFAIDVSARKLENKFVKESNSQLPLGSAEPLNLSINQPAISLLQNQKSMTMEKSAVFQANACTSNALSITVYPGLGPQELCFKRKQVNSNLISMFAKYRNQEKFIDCTLFCEGRAIKCHKLMLCASSRYFENLLPQLQQYSSFPIVVLDNFRFWEIQALVDLIYMGQLNVRQDRILDFIRVANHFQIKW